MLSALSPEFVTHVAQQSARCSGLPVISWQHGFLTHKNGHITQLNDFGNMMTADAVLTFGEEATKAHLLGISKFPSKVVSVGSASVDSARGFDSCDAEEFSKTILYVTTRYYQNMWYYGFLASFNDRHFFRDQTIIMEYLKKIAYDYNPGITVKLPINAPCVNAPFAGEIPETFRIIKDATSFTDLLHKNHIIIVDLPTTTALEALATKKPVFILTKHMGYSDLNKEILKKRAVCTDDPRKLLNAVRSYIEERVYPADVNNNEYLRSHGTYLNDGKSNRRAVEETFRVIKEKCNITEDVKVEQKTTK